MPVNEPKRERPGRTAQLLSLCLRAGKLVMGYDPVKETVQKGKAYLLVVSSGASENTHKRMQFLAEQNRLPLQTVEESLDDLWYILGKRVGVLCITDQALGQKIANEAGQVWAKWEEKV